MLDRLLAVLARGGPHSLAELRQELSISQPLLEQLIQDLTRRGYLRLAVSDCRSHCEGCSLMGTCVPDGPGRLWALTEKGQAAVRLSREGAFPFSDQQPAAAEDNQHQHQSV